MLVKFSKYQGAGNDFVIVDGRDNPIFDYVRDLSNFFKRLCSRNFGVGADGLIVMRKGIETALSMQYFNNDGLEGSMCGNGGRCFAAFAIEKGLVGDEIRFEAYDGVHTAIIHNNQLSVFDISLSMIDVDDIATVPEGLLLNTGSPHLVVFSGNIGDQDVLEQGRKLRYSKRFLPHGVNVNFVKITGKSRIKIRTYERGVENETLACGTGVVAAAIATKHLNNEGHSNNFLVEALGGDLEVSFETVNNLAFKNVWLRGPAEKVFEGKVIFKGE